MEQLIEINKPNISLSVPVNGFPPLYMGSQVKLGIRVTSGRCYRTVVSWGWVGVNFTRVVCVMFRMGRGMLCRWRFWGLSEGRGGVGWTRRVTGSEQ
ncbi:hypothetical protein L873DRAFT_341277 [Choiromyces venosus 120613-1]|uniref:Uncharacterized protein n=1 Tax=Choiromyces venosus 120613-1 TaxID=1336337 RepID=A0A3N4J450_9PEZI|nr:hypothetical protein L873DRAFT_341277 [Choiromyces venosus 120613-1]